MRTREWTDADGQRLVLSEMDGQVRVSIYGQPSLMGVADQCAMGADVPAAFATLLETASDEGNQ